MKDGCTHLAYKAEQAVDLQTGAIVAVTTHGGATGDTESIRETLPMAGEAVAAEIATPSARGQYAVNQNGVEEVVTDKGYHSGAVLSKIAEWGVRSYVSEPERGRRQWAGQPEEQAAVYANRRRITGGRGLTLLRQRGERSEAPCAGPGERAQETARAGGRVQSGAVAALDARRGHAEGTAGSSGGASVCAFARSAGLPNPSTAHG